VVQGGGRGQMMETLLDWMVITVLVLEW